MRRLAGKHRERERRLAELHERSRSGDELPSTDELIERIDLEKQLAGAVQQLPEPQRTVVLLRYYGELSSAEIARRRGVPAGTVRRQLKEGLDRLRERMDRTRGGREAWCTVLLGSKPPVSAAPLVTGGVGMSIATKGLVAAGIVTAVVAIPIYLQSRGEAARASAARLEAPGTEIQPQRVAPVRAVEEQAEPRAVVATETAQTSVPVETKPDLEWDRMEARLRAALEQSIYGSLDPGAILDAALELAEHRADPRAVPEPDPTGALRFEVLDAPEGVSAELRVARSDNPRFASVLGLKLKLEPAADPYVVDGLVRGGRGRST